jgi:hypothetical protein
MNGDAEHKSIQQGGGYALNITEDQDETLVSEQLADLSTSK